MKPPAEMTVEDLRKELKLVEDQVDYLLEELESVEAEAERYEIELRARGEEV